MKKYRSISIFCHYLVQPQEIFFQHPPLSSCLIAPRFWLNISSTSSAMDLLLQQAWAFSVKRGLNRVFSALTVTVETFNHKWRFPFSITVSVASNTLQIKATHDLSRDRRLFHPAPRPSQLDNRLLQLGSETRMKNKFIMPCVAASMPSLVWQFYEIPIMHCATFRQS